MEFDTQYCNICKETVLFHKVTALTEVLELLKFLIEQINCKLLQDSLICEACLAKLQSAYEFKNLYSKNSNIKIEESTENNVTCEICRSTINADDRIPLFDSVTGTGLNLIKYLSRELELKVFENCPTCETCHKSLINFYTITELLSTFDQEHIDCINDSNKVNIKLEIPQIETDCDVNVSVQEENNCMSTDVGEKSGSDGISYKDFMLKNEEVYLKMDTGENPEAETIREHNKRDVKTESNEKRPSKHKNSTETLKCQICEYEPRNKYYLKHHMLLHKDANEVNIYRCQICDYKSKRKESLNLHMLKHKSADEVTTHQCEFCEYTTRYRNNFRSHQLTHKSSDEVKIYRCEICDFKTRRKYALKQHMLKQRHKIADETGNKVFKCQSCDYETKFVSYFKQHTLIHKTPGDVLMYKCQICSYFTNRKDSLKKHTRRKHNLIVKASEPNYKSMEEGGIKMFKCQSCDYETKFNTCIKRHTLIHKTPDEVEMHKCHICKFQTNRKDSLKKHMGRKHKNDDGDKNDHMLNDIHIFKCSICDFEAKHESALQQHMPTHETVGEKEMFKCRNCDYKTEQKYSLEQHLLAHYNFKCQICTFETKEKNLIKQHMLKHINSSTDNC